MPVPVRHEFHGAGIGTPRRRQAADAAGQNDRQRGRGLSDGSGHHRHYPKLICHHGDGGGLRELRADDAASGDQRHYGCQRGHHRYRVAAEPRRYRQRQHVGAAAEAHLLHAGAGTGGHHLLYVLQGQPQEGHRLHPAGLRHADVRHGRHERCRSGLEGCAGLRGSVPRLHEPPAGRAGGRAADGDHPVLLRLRGYPAGTGGHGTGQLRRCRAHHHGTEYRHLRHRADLLRGHQQERKARRHGAPAVQRYRCGGAADGVLHRQGVIRPGTPSAAGIHGGYRRGTLGVQPPVHRHAAALRCPAGEAGDPYGARPGADGGKDRGAGSTSAGDALRGVGTLPRRHLRDGGDRRPLPA